MNTAVVETRPKCYDQDQLSNSKTADVYTHTDPDNIRLC